MELTLGLAKADIIAASQAIEYFELNKIKDIKNIAAYHLQQAAEKLIKYQIYASGKTISNKNMYTHNLEALIIYSKNIGITIYIPKYIRDNSLVISDWEAGSRYDIHFSIRIDTLKKALEVMDGWYNQLKGTK